MILDEKFINEFTEENFKSEFLQYKSQKTDRYNNNVLIPMGTDGVNWMVFEKNIDKLAKDTCKRVKSGKYFFSPFREKEVPKPPYIDLKAARKNNKVRVLSVATIRDVIFQKIIYKSIEEFCENKFKYIDDISFAYRRNKSTSMVIKKIFKLFNNGYYYVLNGDIRHFYDEIPHDKLVDSINNFFGEENKLLCTYFRRFISADRVDYRDYKGKVERYYNKKPKREIRKQGIAQGGVISGVVANIYMYDFDISVKNMLDRKYNDAKYFRYADDFVVVSKCRDDISNIYEEIKKLLYEKGLILHDIGEKTKELDVSNVKKDKLEFLGFEVSPKCIRIKKDNINKFKYRIKEKIDNTKIYKQNPQKGFNILIRKLNFKILGNGAFDDKNLCEICGKKINERNWLTYYKTITDVRQLISLDTWIRKQIYKKYYYCTSFRLHKDLLINSGLESLEKNYYKYKKNKYLNNYCKCCNYNSLLKEEQ